uniref:Uncharacterized protein n=1 Tax=Arundo donax TaxID=35708 RepID=A0A0A9HPR8_ARUDO
MMVNHNCSTLEIIISFPKIFQGN